MRYAALIAAASALAGFASAQNNSNTPIPCCTVSAGQIPAEQRSELCNANENTCVELCGGLGQIASNGNTCDDTTLQTSCKCSNGTDITSNLAKYQQSVAGLMCQNFWYDACISASGSDAAQQRNCVTTRESQCGNLTTDGTSSSDNSASPSASASSGASHTSAGGSSPSHSGTASESSKPTAGAAASLAAYGTPALAGGLFAVFGLVL